MFREGIDDYEYMLALDDWMETAGQNGIDTSNAVNLRGEMNKMFAHPARWSVNDEQYLILREEIADEIDRLVWYTTYGSPEAEITGIHRDGSNVNISLYAEEVYRYNLLRSDELSSPEWQIVDTALVDVADTVILTDELTGLQKAFYKVQVVIP